MQDQSLASAKGFMQHIKKLGKDFAIGRQEDSHEFLVQLLDAIETITLRERGSWADLDARSRVKPQLASVFDLLFSSLDIFQGTRWKLS
jgi:hypothetical protein